jgi:hypothetical protein
MSPKKPGNATRTAEHYYAWCLYLYPRSHRDDYGLLMRQAFRDSYRAAQDAEGQVELRFWVEILVDVTRSLIQEYGLALQACVGQFWSRKAMSVSSALALGFTFVYIIECIK